MEYDKQIMQISGSPCVAGIYVDRFTSKFLNVLN